MMYLRIFPAILIAVLIAVTLGCSGPGNDMPTMTPDNELSASSSNAVSHQTWGLWQFIADPRNETLEVAQLRTGNMHLNALPFLEPPALVNLTLDSLEFNGNILEADTGLRHPFLGLTEFTGFDVCGILITNGSVTGYDDPDLRMAGESDTLLLNPDGYSRWWNPSEFPLNTGTIYGYNDGMLGTPDSFADFNSTLNAYKYFCDDLDVNDPLNEITIDGRGMFSAGQKNVRHYSIELGTDGLVFNYAVDACWQFPQGAPPWMVPGDFPAGANRPESYRIEVTETTNTLYNDGNQSGGDLSISVDVYDWFDAGLNTVKVESPGNFTIQSTTMANGGGEGYSTYGIDIYGATPSPDSIDLLISVESGSIGYGGLLPSKIVTAYFTYSVEISDEPQEVLGWPCFMHDDRHTGVADCALDPSTLELKWTFDTGDTMDSSAVISNGTVYIGNDNMNVYAIDLASGIEDWSTALDDEVTGTAVVGLNEVFIGSKGGFFYALDRDDGSEVWVYEVTETGVGGGDEAKMIQGAILVDGNVYFCANNGYVYCVDASDGAGIWVSPTFEYGNTLHTTPASYAEENQIITTTDGFDVMAFDADDGTEIWKYDVGYFVDVSPTIENGKVYFGDWGNFVYRFDMTGLNPPTLDWSEPYPAPTPFAAVSTGAIDETHYYSLSILNGKLTAHNKDTGAIDWIKPDETIYGFASSPAISGDTIYVGSSPGILYGFNTTTGAEVFKYTLGAGVGLSSTAIAEDRLVVGCSDFNIYCFGPAD